ncbi:hypothetical protein EVAR_81236_1 [Eumeta japonica]|uniref:Uncharacterized protein n=1 Tax=Eumeta variegata TaxID=151549 RepID=A0A4C1V1N5_EUMVA|nr:hypothetical protein EVAR_81236_1 [Eumeta japonica]
MSCHFAEIRYLSIVSGLAKGGVSHQNSHSLDEKQLRKTALLNTQPDYKGGRDRVTGRAARNGVVPYASAVLRLWRSRLEQRAEVELEMRVD